MPTHRDRRHGSTTTTNTARRSRRASSDWPTTVRTAALLVAYATVYAALSVGGALVALTLGAAVSGVAGTALVATAGVGLLAGAAIATRAVFARVLDAGRTGWPSPNGAAAPAANTSADGGAATSLSGRTPFDVHHR